MKLATFILLVAVTIALGTVPARGQRTLLPPEQQPSQLTDSGHIVVAGHSTLTSSAICRSVRFPSCLPAWWSCLTAAAA